MLKNQAKSTDLTVNEVSELLRLVAHVHDTTVTTHTLEVLLSDVDDQRGAADGVVAAAHNVDLDARLGGRVEPIPVRDD